MTKKNFFVILLFSIIVVVFVTQFQKHNEDLKKKEFKKEVLYLVKNADLNRTASILDSPTISIAEYGFGILETENHREIDLGRTPKQYTGGKIIVQANGSIEAVFFNDKWCAKYNGTTKDVDVKDYDNTCSFSEPTTTPNNTPNEVSLESELIKNLKYPIEYSMSPSIIKMKYYEKDKYTISDFSDTEKLAIALDDYLYVKVNVYAIDEQSGISWETSSKRVNPVDNETIRKHFSSIWGPDTNYEPQSVNSNFGTIATYLPEQKQYQIDVPYGLDDEIHNPAFTEIITKPYKVIQKENQLMIYEYAYYRKCTDVDACTYYADKELTEIITTSDDIHKEIDPVNFSNVRQYRYIFTKQSDQNYYFDTAEWL